MDGGQLGRRGAEAERPGRGEADGKRALGGIEGVAAVQGGGETVEVYDIAHADVLNLAGLANPLDVVPAAGRVHDLDRVEWLARACGARPIRMEAEEHDAATAAISHVPLVVGPDGLRLAKRHGDTRVAHFRARGIAPERLIGWLATSCGLAPPGAALLPRDLVASFAWGRVPRDRVVCDEASLLSELA